MSKVGSNTTFKWNYKNSVIIQRKGFTKELNKYFADIVAKYADEFVPYVSGRLSHDIQTFGAKDHGTVTYKVPYASTQYTSPTQNRNRQYHPLATSYWDKYMWAQYKTQILDELDQKRRELSV